VCGIVGIVLFCSPILGGILGVVAVVFGGLALYRGGRGFGFAVAGLVCGIVAIVIAIIVFLVALSIESSRSRRYYYRHEGRRGAIVLNVCPASRG